MDNHKAPDTPRSRQRRLEKVLLRRTARACRDFNLLEPGDRVMACISGGKDSYAMLRLLKILQRKAPFEFSIVAVNLDQGQPSFPKHVLPEYLAAEGHEFRVVEKDTYSIVKAMVPEGKTYCSLCSRLRRGILYDVAEELGATKVALGHHRDDMLETLLLNLFYSGQLKSMPPRLRSDDGRNVVIRPLAYCSEEDIAEYAGLVGFPIIPCDLCGSQENMMRQQVKELITQLHTANNTVRGNMFAAMANVRVSHLMDTKLRALAGMSDPMPEAGDRDTIDDWGLADAVDSEMDEGVPPAAPPAAASPSRPGSPFQILN